MGAERAVSLDIGHKVVDVHACLEGRPTDLSSLVDIS